MKKYLSLSIPLLSLVLLFILFHDKADSANENNIKNKECLFNHKTAFLLGKLYDLSSPVKDPNALASFIQHRWEYFMEDGILIKSTRALGYWMLYQDKESFDEHTIDRIRNKLINCDISPDSACKLLLQFKNGDVDFSVLGNELIWLADVLPEMARGNMLLYLHTGTKLRSNIRKIIPIYRSIAKSDPQIATGILEDIDNYDKVSGEQISLLALISDI